MSSLSENVIGKIERGEPLPPDLELSIDLLKKTGVGRSSAETVLKKLLDNKFETWGNLLTVVETKERMIEVVGDTVNGTTIWKFMHPATLATAGYPKKAKLALAQLPPDLPVLTTPIVDDALRYVDDGGKVPQIVAQMERSLINCGRHRTQAVIAEVITGHPGIGKTRLAMEVAKAFVNRRPNERLMFKFSLNQEEFQEKSLSLEESPSSLDILGALLVLGLFRLNPQRYDVDWRTVVQIVKMNLPELRAIVLVVDEFTSSLSTSERIMSACGAVASETSPFYILPIFAGVHRARELYGLTARASGWMGTNAIVVSSLGDNARLAIIESLALAVDVPTEHLRKSLGPLLEDCGGWPSFVAVLYAFFIQEDFDVFLQKIRTHAELGTETAKKLWDDVVKDFSAAINILRFAELVSCSKERQNPQATPYTGDARTKTKSALIAKLVLERLVLFAMTGVSVPLDDTILREEDAPELLADEDIRGMTYQLAGSMVEITSDGDTGQVIMPVVAVAALNSSFGMKRRYGLNLNPFVNTPAVLEELAVESVANMIKVHRFLRKSTMSVAEFRKGSRFYGNHHLTIRVPNVCELVHLADHMETNTTSNVVPTESNGNGMPVTFTEGVCYVTATNQRDIDGGAFLKEATTLHDVIFLSQSKFQMECIPQSGKDGGEAAIAKAEAKKIIEVMRKQAQEIHAKLSMSKRTKVSYVYDVFTTRNIGARLANLGAPFDLKPNELVLLTTKDCIRTALGPILSVRANMAE